MTTMPDNFGEIRSILQRAPAPEVWEDLCDQIALWSWPHYETFEQQILPYILHHLEGWPDALRCAPDRWLPGLLRAAPMPWAPMIRALDASDQGFGAADIETLVLAPVLAHLRELDLSHNRFGTAGLELLLRSGQLAGLRKLNLRMIPLGAAVGLLLAVPDQLVELETLDVTGTGLNGEGLGMLVLRDPHPALVRLTLDHNPLGARTIHTLGRAPIAARLQELSLVRTRLAMRDALELAHAPARFTALHTLDLSENQLGEQTLQMFARNAQLPALRRLALRGNLIGPEGARALAQGGALDAIEELDLRHCRIGAAGAIALTATNALPALRRVIILREDVAQNGWEALTERFPEVSEEK
jgi:hypothetical protein